MLCEVPGSGRGCHSKAVKAVARAAVRTSPGLHFSQVSASKQRLEIIHQAKWWGNCETYKTKQKSQNGCLVRKTRTLCNKQMLVKMMFARAWDHKPSATANPPAFL